MTSKKGKKQQLQEQKNVDTKRSKISHFFTLLVLLGLSVVALEPFYRPDKAKNDLYVAHIFNKTTEATYTGLTWIDEKLEKSVPEQYHQVKKVSQPYLELASKLGRVMVNAQFNIRENFVRYAKEKYPVAQAYIDHYAPGLIDTTQNIFQNIYSQTLYCYRSSVDYLKNRVFVGQLSPENLQQVVVDAYKKTSEKAVEYYHWIYKKVQTTIK